MKKDFNNITNSWLYKTSKAIGDVVIMSALFLLFCLPVITIGASVSALYYTVYRKYHKKSDTLTNDFMSSLRLNLKNGIIVHLIYTGFCALAGFNIYFAFFGLGDVKLPDWYTVVSFLPLIPVIFSLPFIYPLMARFSNGIKGTITNSYTLCMVNFPKFLLLWLIFAAALAISLVFPPAALLTPVGAMYLTQMITEKAFADAISVEKSRDKKDISEHETDSPSDEEPDTGDEYDSLSTEDQDNE